jgi:hypothetical protein
MPARQSFYAESLAESSTTSADWTNALSLTFTPDDDADYWLFASAAFTNSSGSNDHVGWVSLYHVQAEAVLLEQSMQRQEPSSPQDWVGFFGIARLSFGTAPGEQQLDVNISSSHAGDTTRIRDVRLLLIKAKPPINTPPPMRRTRPAAPAGRRRRR